jgi:DNA-binding MarR family transcriptional regulator
MGFSELEREAWGGFLSTYAYLNRIVEEDLQSHSQVTHVELEILLRLSRAENQRMRIQDLAVQSLLTRSGVSRAVSRLETAGLVTREEAAEDRRGAYAILTKEGAQRFQNAVEPHIAFVKEHFLNLFSEQELKQMAKFWKRLQER